jgi:glycosyltransferase involved in cell wall biosynthesis
VRLYHAHVTKRMGGIVRTAARLRRKPFVVTLHGNTFDVPTEEADTVVAAQQGHYEWGRPFGMLFGSRSLLQEADAVICVGRSEYEAACAHLGAERMHYLPNGVVPASFAGGERLRMRSELGIGEGDFCFGCISRIDPQKNQKLLTEAFLKIADQEPRARLVICGPVTREEYLAEIKALVAASPHAGRVRILPPVEPESPRQRDLYAALDAFVLASRHEPFGIVVLEAWAAGKPVIAAKVGGLGYLVRHEDNGLIFSPGRVDELVANMRTLMENPAFGAELAERAKNEVVSEYTWSKIAAKQESIYQEAEERRR